ncbi:UDP-glucose/GDP-mannose dehydrogenase family protein [Candidatus Uhrbacteria bacterium]|nr:UDP-glucose/GDP-mannose dehydrogenase family protein [Candidatus Uhrbacteria bacterium]
MKLVVVGTGYVGLVSGACLADVGHTVICVDVDALKIEKLKSGVIPIFEPGLEEVVQRGVESGRFLFTTNLKEAMEGAQVILIAVGTPSTEDGSVNMAYVESAARDIGRAMTEYTVVIDKSTVPVGTTEWVHSIIRHETSCDFDVVSVPEFLREGHAIQDFMKPHRIVIGTHSTKAINILLEVFSAFQCPKVIMDERSAELTKYAANSFLAMKIGFINEIASLCERLGADVDQVAKGIGLDPRIGADFLRAGLGWGGSCFPKDVRALKNLGDGLGVSLPIINASLDMNTMSRQRVVDRLVSLFDGTIEGKKIAVLGIAFKPNTDDTRESAAIALMQILKEKGADVYAYDPIAEFHSAYHGFDVKIGESPYHIAQDAHAIILATEWHEFTDLDLTRIKQFMADDVMVDARNFFDPVRVKEAGFRYLRVGNK